MSLVENLADQLAKPAKHVDARTVPMEIAIRLKKVRSNFSAEIFNTRKKLVLSASGVTWMGAVRALLELVEEG